MQSLLNESEKMVEMLKGDDLRDAGLISSVQNWLPLLLGDIGRQVTHSGLPVACRRLRDRGRAVGRGLCRRRGGGLSCASTLLAEIVNTTTEVIARRMGRAPRHSG
jgi:hypothetical protein